MVFGQNKIKFDARREPGQRHDDLFENPQAYTFVHNFKVHYKRGVLQALANKADVSINSSVPQLPDLQLVSDEFNRRMTATVVVSDTRKRYSEASFHITNIEYKESFAIRQPVGQHQSPAPAGTAPSQGVLQPGKQVRSGFCAGCGNRLPPDSLFCNRCGRQVSPPS